MLLLVKRLKHAGQTLRSMAIGLWSIILVPATQLIGTGLKNLRLSVKVGDLVREKGLQERTGVILEDLNAERLRHPSGYTRLFKVLWSELSPTSPTLIGGAWCNQLEVINENR